MLISYFVLKIFVAFFYEKEYENINPLPYFKGLNINTLLITAVIRNSSGFAILYTCFVKNVLVKLNKINTIYYGKEEKKEIIPISMPSAPCKVFF